MIAIDTNVLVYAHVQSFPKHAAAREALVRLAEGAAPWGIPAPCLTEFIRIVTHPRVLEEPYPIPDAVAAVGAILESPSCRVLAPTEQHWSFFAQVLERADARGNLAFDAAIAAVCEETGVMRILTEDRDFTRFDGVEVVHLHDPLA